LIMSDYTHLFESIATIDKNAMFEARCSILDTRYWILDARCSMLDAGCSMLDARYWIIDKVFTIELG
jgi:hypothetical protein